MAAFKLTFNQQAAKKLIERLRSLKAPIDKATATAVGKEVVSEMKELISQGTSPIAGKGKFPGYKDKTKYPGKKKAPSPVNLKLSGDFLSGLEFKTRQTQSGHETEVGYFDRKQAIKEQGHRDGANSQPKRPTIPEGNEKFHLRIMEEIIRVYQERIAQIIKK